MKDSLTFLLEFLRDPGSIGALAPSSEHLAREIVSGLGLSEASLVLEYGPGTGAFTGAIRERIPETAEFYAIEQNSRLAEKLRRRHPEVSVLEESIADAPELLRRRGHAPGTVDAIVSGLPWAAFARSRQRRLLEATLEMLAPGGRFATFAYIHGVVLPAGRRFRSELDRRFGSVSTSRIVWRNLPPAFVYRCSAPGEKTASAFR